MSYVQKEDILRIPINVASTNFVMFYIFIIYVP